ncbi:MAG: hypothetical protein ACI93T_003618 [Porticoccaceae bacterium]|jgi:hypothetical protein
MTSAAPAYHVCHPIDDGMPALRLSYPTETSSATPREPLPLFYIRKLTTADLSKLVARDDRLDRNVKSVFIILQTLLHFGNERFVRKLDFTTEGEPQEFTAELTDNVVSSLSE